MGNNIMGKIKNQNQLLLLYILNLSLITWVLIGFSISYLVFFVHPVFFSARVMQFFEYVPIADIAGNDLMAMISYSESWFIAKQTPYIGANLYPPLASVLFTPLLSMDFSLAYRIITTASVLCYVMMTIVFPLWVCKEKQVSPLLMLFFITGLFSYGFQFELERGQFNVIAVFLCFLAIWIYHYHGRYRYLGYVLFVISVQLKIYPFIYVIMFIDNWQDWKSNIKRLLVLTTANLALFFVLGLNVFINFISAAKWQALDPFVWVGNHSIRSFITMASHKWGWVNQNSDSVQLVFLAIVTACICTAIFQSYRQNQKGISPYLLLVCTIGALLIPSVSHDYKLSILAAPVAIFLSSNSLIKMAQGTRQHIFFIILVLIFSVAYFSTLFSFTNKQAILQTNSPALGIMLLVATLLALGFKPWTPR
jgi:hypothetical protein